MKSGVVLTFALCILSTLVCGQNSTESSEDYPHDTTADSASVPEDSAAETTTASDEQTTEALETTTAAAEQQATVPDVNVKEESDAKSSNESSMVLDSEAPIPKSERGPLEKSFPKPERLAKMIEQAKIFIHRYMSDDEWHKLKKLVNVVREIGGERRDTRKAVRLFLTRVLTAEERQEIKDRREELFRIFADEETRRRRHRRH